MMMYLVRMVVDRCDASSVPVSVLNGTNSPARHRSEASPEAPQAFVMQGRGRLVTPGVIRGDLMQTISTQHACKSNILRNVPIVFNFFDHFARTYLAFRTVSRGGLLCLSLLLCSFVAQAQTTNICDRTDEVEQGILTALSATDCTAITSAQLARITQLNLRSKGISSLKSGDFDGLTNLEFLYLDKNSLTEVPADLFDGLTNLETVSLRQNSLTEVPADLFDGLTNLEGVYLYDNSLTEVPADLFDGLTNLETLDLSANSLTEVPADLFDGLTNLEILYLHRNSLTEVPADLFDGLTNLEWVFLYDNSLRVLPADLFDGLTNLEWVFLYDNSLRVLPADLFDGLTNLEILYLHRNSLTGLPADLFDGLTNLETLSLYYNSLTEVSAVLFDGLTNLEALYLSNNSLTVLPADLFDGLTNLEELDLSANSLTGVPADLFDGLFTSGSTNILWLGNNDLTSFPASLFDHIASETELRLTVYLRGNSIQCFDPFYDGIPVSVDHENSGVVCPGRQITLTVEPGTVGESATATSATVTATLDAARTTDTPVTVTMGSDTDTATKGTDYATVDAFSISIPDNTISVTGTFMLTPTNDTTDEDDETLSITGESTVMEVEVLGTSMTIIDDDGAPEVTLVLSATSISENGGITTVTAMLDRASSATTTVTVSVAPDSPATASDYTLSTNQVLTIVAGEMSSTGEVAITGVDNPVDTPNKTVQVKGVATNEQGVAAPSEVELTITDDDAIPTVTLALSATSISENGGITTVTAMLDRASSATTTVTVSVAPDSPATASDYTLSTNQVLTIVAGEMSSTGEVAITGVDNPVDTPNKTVQVKGVATNEQGVAAPSEVELTITDDDAIPTVTLALSATSISENGGITTVTAMLDRASSATTTVTVSVAPDSPATASDYTLSTNQVLTIVAGEMSSTGEVAITGVDNPVDTPNKTVRVQGSAANTQGVTAPSEVELTITDDDAIPTVTLALSATSISENGGITTVTAMLDRASSATTTVTVSVAPDSPATASDYTLSTNQVLTIVAGEMSSTGEVAITGVDNPVDTPNKTVRVQGSAANTQGVTAPSEVELTITDDDAIPTVTLALSATSISENGGITTVTAMLDRASSAATTVTVSVAPDSPATTSDYMLSSNQTLTIAAGETSSTEEVTITGVDNPVDTPNKTVQVKGMATNEQGITAPLEVELTITDDDEAGIVVDPQSVIVVEGQTATFTVRIAGQPSGSVTVIIPTPVGDLTATPPSLQFTVDSWNTYQPVTLAAAEDTDGLADEMETLQLTATGAAEYAGKTSEVMVTIKDDEQASIVVNPSALTVTEGSLSRAFTVELSAKPTADVTVTLSDDGDSDLSWSGSTFTGNALTFTPADYGAQTVTLTAAADDDGLADEMETLRLTATGAAEYAGKTGEVTVTIKDDEQAGIVVNPSALTVTEGGLGGSFTVVLSEVPGSDVTVTLSDDGNPDLVWSGDTLIENTLTFTSANHRTPQMVTLSAAEDPDLLDEDVTLRLTASGGEYAEVTAQIMVMIMDDDEGAIVTPSSVTMEEGGTYLLLVGLSAPPSGPVTVDLSGHAETDLALDQTSLLFTSVDWQTSKPVTLTAAVDADFSDNMETLTLTASGGGYDRVRAEIPVIITDMPPPPRVFVSLSASPLRVDEGESVTVTATLSEVLAIDVTIPLTLTDVTADAQDYRASSPARIEVIAGQTRGSYSISTIQDEVVESEETFRVALGVLPSGLVKGKEVEIRITDDDAAEIQAPESVLLAEGGEQSFEIWLTSEPSGEVLVTLTWPSDAGLMVRPITRIFTADNWRVGQQVTLSAAEDPDLLDEDVTLRLTASGGEYAEVTAQVMVMIMDDDEGAIVTPSSVTMEEGGTHLLLVGLSAEPSGPVTVNFSGHTGTDLALDKTFLTFTPAEWQPRTVTLTAMEDDDYVDDTEVLTLTASGGYDGVTAAITVMIEDDDEGLLTISIWDQRGLENAGAIQLPVELSRSTDQVVTVQYRATDKEAEAGLDYTASRGIVIFDPGAIHGVIEIEVTDDEIPEGTETFAVTLSKPRNAIIARETGTGTILDDDGGTAILRVDDALVLEEEGMVRFRVSLSSPQRQLVSAAYRTRDGTAKAGEDYAASSGVVTLAPGTVEAMIAVPLLKDGLDWREETFTVHLESSKHAEIAKAVGVATIQESTTVSEAVLEAYTARFVRTSSVQIVEALGERFRSGADGAACGAGARAELARLWYSASSWDPSLGELLAGCRMSASSYSGSFSVWGRGVFRRFNGRTGDGLTLNGEVTTGMLGADYRWRGGWLAGVVLAHSRGTGSFEVVQQSGEMSAGLTGVYPYVSYARAEWDVWLSAGAGRGQAEVLDRSGDLISRFGAMGVRGTLVSTGPIGLDYHGDVLVTDAEIKDHAVTAEVYRVRAGVEASARISDGLRPYVESNVRTDGGSAETGVGLEFGGGMRIVHPAWHLKADVRAQGLVMHTAEGFTEWGVSGFLQVGDRSEGLMLRVRPSWGRGQGMSMYGQQTILDAVPLGADAHRTELELGYGAAWKDGTARSIIGVTQLPQGMMYRLGGELHPWERLTFSVFGLAHGRATAIGNIGVNVRGSLRY